MENYSYYYSTVKQGYSLKYHLKTRVKVVFARELLVRGCRLEFAIIEPLTLGKA